MSKIEENVVMEEQQKDEEIIEVSIVEKQTLGAKVKNCAKKVISSKPAKIVGGVVLVAAGALGAVALSKRNNNGDDDDICDALPLDEADDGVVITEI